MGRAISPSQLIRRKHTLLYLSETFISLVGEQEACGVWLVWGHSTNGKTSFCMQLAKELCGNGVVGYFSFEEKGKKSMQDHMLLHSMGECEPNFKIFPDEDFEALKNRLDKRRSPRFIFIDSLQHLGITRSQYDELKRRYRDKLFILVSHAEGKNPTGNFVKTLSNTMRL